VLRLSPLYGEHVIRIDFIVSRLNVEYQELALVTRFHLRSDPLVIETLSALDNLRTRIS